MPGRVGTLALIPLLLMVARAAHRPVVVEAGPTAGEGVLDDVASRIGTGIGRTWRRLAVPALLLLWLVWLVDLLLGYGEGMRHAVVCALCIIGMPAVDQIVASIFGPQARSGRANGVALRACCVSPVTWRWPRRPSCC